MKKIVLNQKADIVNLNDTNLKYNLYYGVTNGIFKFFIQSESFFSADSFMENKKNKWVLKCHEELILNRQSFRHVQVVPLTIREYITSLLHNDMEVFVFDNFIEFALWLNEKENVDI